MPLNQRGFTLTESLIALAVTSILASFSIPGITRFYDHFQLNRVISVLQSDLHRVRDYNVVPLQGGESKSLVIHHQEGTYDLVIGNRTLLTRQLPSQVVIEGSGTTSITFTSSGTISRAGSLIISSRYTTRRMVFSIGIGGIDIRDY